MESFFDRLIEIVARVAQGKETTFAKKAGIPQGTFHRYYSRQGMPKPDHLVRIAEAGTTTIDWLLTGRSASQETLNERRHPYVVVWNGIDRRKDHTLRTLIDKAVAVLRSEDEVTKVALEQNIVAFHRALEHYRKVGQSSE